MAKPQAPRQSVRATHGRRELRSHDINLWRVCSVRWRLTSRALNVRPWPAPPRQPPALSRPLPCALRWSSRHVGHGPCSSPPDRVAGPPTRHATAGRRQGPRPPVHPLPGHHPGKGRASARHARSRLLGERLAMLAQQNRPFFTVDRRNWPFFVPCHRPSLPRFAERNDGVHVSRAERPSVASPSPATARAVTPLALRPSLEFSPRRSWSLLVSARPCRGAPYPPRHGRPSARATPAGSSTSRPPSRQGSRQRPPRPKPVAR